MTLTIMQRHFPLDPILYIEFDHLLAWPEWEIESCMDYMISSYPAKGREDDHTLSLNARLKIFGIVDFLDEPRVPVIKIL
jgi:hypothetical protein